MSTFHIDPTKIKPDMVIHTPTLEQAQTVCSYLSNKKFMPFDDYKEATCIATNDGTCWSYSPKSFYKDEGYTITPFEDILVKDWKKILTTTKCAVTVNSTAQIEYVKELVGAIREEFTTSYQTWLDKYPNNCTIAIDSRKSTPVLNYSRKEYFEKNKYQLYEFSEIFPTTETTIDRNWTKLDKVESIHKYKPGDKVLVKPNLGGYCNTTSDMETLIGKVVTIKEQISGDYYSVEEMGYAWHEQMLEPYLQFKIGNTVVLKSSITKIPENMKKYKFIKPTLITDIDYELEIATLSNGLDYHFNLLDLYTTTTVAPSTNPIPTIKEPEMNNTTLRLLLTLMGVTTETVKDATNSNYIGIITDSDNTYIGYVYADTIKQLKEIIAKSENEGNTIHCFKFQDSFKQATRPVVKVTRTTSEVVEESNVSE